MPVNFKIYPVLKHATIVPPGITKTRLEWRIVLGAFLENLPPPPAPLYAMNAGLTTTNRNPMLKNALLLQKDKSLQVKDRQRSSYRSGLKLMPLLRPDLQPVQPEQKAARHPMNRVKIARRANPVPKEPPNANRVAKESSVPKMAPPV